MKFIILISINLILIPSLGKQSNKILLKQINYIDILILKHDWKNRDSSFYITKDSLNHLRDSLFKQLK